MAQYARPDVLVDTKFVMDNLNNETIRIVEVDYDHTTAYDVWHIPGAVLLRWREDLRHPEIRDFVSPEQFEDRLSKLGISNEHIVILYGDYNNWFAAYTFWLFKAYGHEDVRLLNGGRTNWAKLGLPTSKEVPNYPRTSYKVKKVDWGSHRTFLWEVLQRVTKGETGKLVTLIDVRSQKEYTGEIKAPPEYADEQTQVGGHIPGAVNIPWAQAVDPDTGEFKPVHELAKIYGNIPKDKEIITYCRIGERAAHTWFVLKYLLGYPSVRVYDGSSAEWNNIVGIPVKKGTEP
ncbi:rhodanese-related sulfurtransferase [Metallosphaera yellowstonensis MK1]|uniref:Rhodanese-related sulfurtransferase n=1 Tax=Metallosphaera yellowstonensis MK1 TaxID=671065 RepID=H2C1J0_9CREN|nr:sulfurtransferase [Metallosphaera yellowstonensis]EHP70111.1 rhodanese-related sulfurtransferase [Metallosphaera yellowstonensis MK1]